MDAWVKDVSIGRFKVNGVQKQNMIDVCHQLITFGKH